VTARFRDWVLTVDISFSCPTLIVTTICPTFCQFGWDCHLRHETREIEDIEVFDVGKRR